MSSTPSASALSAVLRCQGNILARKQAKSKRPPASVYGLGATDSLRTYFRSLGGLVVFHRERVDIPGVLSVTARVETSCSGKDLPFKNSPKFDNSRLTVKASSASQWPKTKGISDNRFAVKAQRYSASSQTNAVLRLDGKLSRKLNWDDPWTLCVCVVCAPRISALNNGSVSPLFPLGLLWYLKNKLIYFTAALSDSVRDQLGMDGMNQLHPDCDKLSGCVKCISEHHEDQPKTLQGDEPGE